MRKYLVRLLLDFLSLYISLSLYNSQIQFVQASFSLISDRKSILIVIQLSISSAFFNFGSSEFIE